MGSVHDLVTPYTIDLKMSLAYSMHLVKQANGERKRLSLTP